MNKKRRVGAGASRWAMTALCLALLPGNAAAQSGGTSSTEQLETVTVQPEGVNPSQLVVGPTGGESLAPAYRLFLDTPSSVTLLDGETLDEWEIRTLRDLTTAAPNVTGFDGGGNRMTQLSIRGVREFGYQSSPGVGPNVSYYIDDIPALSQLARASLFSNVGVVELYKGPQGSTFGSSLNGGVINIRSVEPSDFATAYASAGFGNYNSRDITAGFSAPLSDNHLYATMDVVSSSRDGFYTNIATGSPYGDKDAQGVRGKLTWQPSQDVSVDLILLHERFDDESDPFIPLPQLKTSPRKVDYNDPGFEDIGQDLQAVRVRANLPNDIELLSVSAHRVSTWDFLNDGDLTSQPASPFNPFSRLLGYTKEKIEAYSQEIRLKSDRPDARVNWRGGLFAAHQDMDFDAGVVLFPFIESPFFPLRHSENIDIDLAAFGEVSIQLTDTVSVSPGLRYEHAYRKGTNEFSAPNITSASETFDEVLPSIAVVLEPNPNVSAFARYARGLRPGGFISDRETTLLSEFGYDSEISDNFEVGFKKVLKDNRLILNGSLFYSDFENYQVLNQFSATNFGVNNAQEARSYGGELVASYQVTPTTKLNGGFGYTNAKFDRFVNSFGNFSGNYISFVPETTINYGFEYRSPWGGYFLFDGRTLGQYYLDEANAAEQDPVSIVDILIGYKKRNLDVSAYVRNVFDEEYVIGVYDFAGTGTAGFGTLGDPRTFGVRAKITLGGEPS